MDTFFDYFEYNTDSWPTAPIGSEDMIAEMYFRLEVDQITHARQVYNSMMFIGDLGGVKDILLQIGGWVIGSFSAFHISWSMLSSLQFVRMKGGNIYQKSKQNNPAHQDVYKMKLPLKTRLFLWMNTTMCGFMCKPCRKPNHEKYLEIFEAGSEKIEADFDIFEII